LKKEQNCEQCTCRGKKNHVFGIPVALERINEWMDGLGEGSFLFFPNISQKHFFLLFFLHYFARSVFAVRILMNAFSKVITDSL
jgi:hypothetical protein